MTGQFWRALHIPRVLLPTLCFTCLNLLHIHIYIYISSSVVTKSFSCPSNGNAKCVCISYDMYIPVPGSYNALGNINQFSGAFVYI